MDDNWCAQPTVRDFCMKMGPMFRDFFQKTDPKMWHIPYVLTCEYPRPAPRQGRRLLNTYQYVTAPSLTKNTSHIETDFQYGWLLSQLYHEVINHWLITSWFYILAYYISTKKARKKAYVVHSWGKYIWLMLLCTNTFLMHMMYTPCLLLGFTQNSLSKKKERKEKK